VFQILKQGIFVTPFKQSFGFRLFKDRQDAFGMAALLLALADHAGVSGFRSVSFPAVIAMMLKPQR
jgi:hypothetical protein